MSYSCGHLLRDAQPHCYLTNSLASVSYQPLAASTLHDRGTMLVLLNNKPIWSSLICSHLNKVKYICLKIWLCQFERPLLISRLKATCSTAYMCNTTMPPSLPKHRDGTLLSKIDCLPPFNIYKKSVGDPKLFKYLVDESLAFPCHVFSFSPTNIMYTSKTCPRQWFALYPIMFLLLVLTQPMSKV